VIRWGKWTYWALSYFDNHSAFLITPVDRSGNIATTPWPKEKTGARYEWNASVDTNGQTVTYSGQDVAPSTPGAVTITWADLHIDQP
jgi:hypothetical protein